MDSTKPSYLSKTVWINIIMAVIVMFPAPQAWISAHPGALEIAFGVINIVLRAITKDKLSLI